MALPPFQQFLDAHRIYVMRFLVAAVGRDEAEDCFQETFVAALRAYPRLRAESNLRAWVLTIAHRKALDAHRARVRRPVPVEATAETAASDRRSTVDGLPRGTDEGGAVWHRVRDLPARQRQAIVLRYACDLPYRDMAAAMGCSEEAARRSVFEGLAKLRRVMG